MVGTHVARRAVDAGYQVRALVREGEYHGELTKLCVEIVAWDLLEPDSFPAAVADQEVIVHTAAHVGDWGPPEKYRDTNVHALDKLLKVVLREGKLRRWVQLSSLGVYPAQHHYGTDERTPPNLNGFDGYTRTKAEADLLLDRFIDEHDLPVVKLRPGFMYGEGDRHVVPRLVELLKSGRLLMVGDGKKLSDNTYVGSLADATMLAIEKPGIEGEAFNIRDQRLVDRNEFIGAVAEYLEVPFPRRVPLWAAKAAVGPVERVAKLMGRQSAPLVTHARMKFMTLNLDYSIEKAKRELGYRPTMDFQDGIKIALDWITGKEVKGRRSEVRENASDLRPLTSDA
jgi:nucleoside-diphosphate-sugar epimerase